jgi:hypothetical protein
VVTRRTCTTGKHISSLLYANAKITSSILVGGNEVFFFDLFFDPMIEHVCLRPRWHTEESPSPVECCQLSKGTIVVSENKLCRWAGRFLVFPAWRCTSRLHWMRRGTLRNQIMRRHKCKVHPCFFRASAFPSASSVPCPESSIVALPLALPLALPQPSSAPSKLHRLAPSRVLALATAVPPVSSLTPSRLPNVVVVTRIHPPIQSNILLMP